MLEMRNDPDGGETKKEKVEHNIIFHYECKILIARHYLKKYGKGWFLGEDCSIETEEKNIFDVPVEEKQDLIRFLEKKPYFSDKQLGKEMFRESEYFWNI